MSDPDISPEWERLGLFNPSGPDAEQRRELFLFYEEHGVIPGDFADVDPAHVMMVANQRAIRPGRRVGAAEAMQQSGLDPDLFRQVSTAAGFPADGATFTPLDITTLQVFDLAAQFFSREEMLHFTGVMSSSLARIADAATALFRIDITSEIEASGGTDMDFAVKNFEAADLVRAMTEPLWSLFVLQLELAAMRSDQSRLAMEPDADASTVRMGVGFVDLVGFTPLSVEMTDTQLGLFIRQFEKEATAIVSSHGGRLVKLIGDEVMFVAVHPNDVVHIASELMAAFTADGVQPHGGVAYGDLVARGGDYYGQLVNLASRVADLAVPGELLTDDATAAAADAHGFEPAGRRQIKGFPEPIRLNALATLISPCD